MFQKSLNATGKVSLGTPGTGLVGGIVFQIIDDADDWSGSIVVKGRVGGERHDGTPVPDAALTAVSYYNVATKDFLVASTAITAEGIYAVEAPGLEVVLDYTHTAGSATVYGTPLEYPLSLLNTAAPAEET